MPCESEYSPMTDLITQYRALPTGTPMAQAARVLGVSLGRLEKAKSKAGLTTKGGAADPAEDERLATAYSALPLTWTFREKAAHLRVGERRLEGALLRSGKRRGGVERVARAVEARTARVSCEALPAGARESWGCLTWMTGEPVGEWVGRV